jgi:hypothetical protein
MTGIVSMRRDYGDNVTIVRILTTDVLSTVEAAGYILAQQANIILANNGIWSWLPSDYILVSAADGWAWFSLSADGKSLIEQGSDVQQAIIPLTLAQLQGMYAAPVPILPAPAAGQLILVKSALLNITYGSAAFAGGGAIQLQYGNTVHGGGVAASTSVSAASLIAVAANESLLFSPPASIISAGAIGAGIWLSNATAAFTGGTGDTANLIVNYTAVPGIN